jgi:hypothetical protein
MLSELFIFGSTYMITLAVPAGGLGRVLFCTSEHYNQPSPFDFLRSFLPVTQRTSANKAAGHHDIFMRFLATEK